MIDKKSEEYRHQCEVRWCIRLGLTAKAALDSFIAKVKSKRGAEKAEKLHDDARSQYLLGNTGKHGVWK